MKRKIERNGMKSRKYKKMNEQMDGMKMGEIIEKKRHDQKDRKERNEK